MNPIDRAFTAAPNLSSIAFGCLMVAIILAIVGCASGTAPTSAQVQAISSEAACIGQAAANVSTDELLARGDQSGAAQAVGYSRLLGALCTGLPVGAPLVGG